MITEETKVNTSSTNVDDKLPSQHTYLTDNCPVEVNDNGHNSSEKLYMDCENILEDDLVKDTFNHFNQNNRYSYPIYSKKEAYEKDNDTPLPIEQINIRAICTSNTTMDQDSTLNKSQNSHNYDQLSSNDDINQEIYANELTPNTITDNKNYESKECLTLKKRIKYNSPVIHQVSDAGAHYCEQFIDAKRFGFNISEFRNTPKIYDFCSDLKKIIGETRIPRCLTKL